jgi:hypothetical protein
MLHPVDWRIFEHFLIIRSADPRLAVQHHWASLRGAGDPLRVSLIHLTSFHVCLRHVTESEGSQFTSNQQGYWTDHTIYFWQAANQDSRSESYGIFE